MRGVLLSAKSLLASTLALALAGCLPSTGTPERLYPVASEMDVVRTTQEELVRQYNLYVFSAPAQARLLRNEIIAERMYAVDVQYTQYENALTREGQEVNFATLTTAGALGTASTLFTPVVTKSVLSALSTGTIATKGYYDSEILMAQTIRTIQKQMRASRNLIATNISAKLVQSVTDYPLSAALSDVEDYYNAGTLTTGVIDTSTTVGIREDFTKGLKQEVTQAPPELRAAIIRDSTIADATTPMANPHVFGPLNPDGKTDFERRGLTPAKIKEMEAVVCLQPKTGRLTPALRTAVLAHLNKPNAVGINDIDAQRITNEFNAITNGEKKNPCGP
jgi:hypothetical protein